MKKLLKYIVITVFTAIFFLIGYNFAISNQDLSMSFEPASLPTKEAKLATYALTDFVPSNITTTALVSDSEGNYSENSDLFTSTLTAENATGTPLKNTFSVTNLPYSINHIRMAITFSNSDSILKVDHSVEYNTGSPGGGSTENFLDGPVDFDIPSYVSKVTITLQVYSNATNYEVYYINVNHNTSPSTDCNLKTGGVKIVSDEGKVLCQGFSGTSLTMLYALPYNSTGFTVTAEANDKFAKKITIQINNQVQSHYSIDYGSDLSNIDNPIYKQQTFTIKITVEAESGRTKTYTGALHKMAADDTQTFTIKDAIAYYLDEDGQEQTRNFALSELGEGDNGDDAGKVEESKDTVKIFGTDAENSLPFSTYKIIFKIKPDSETAKVYIDALEGTLDEDGYYEFVYDDFSFSLSKRTERKRLLIKTEKFQLLRPNSLTSGGGEYYLSFSSANPDSTRNLTKVSAVHMDTQAVLAELSTISPVGIGIDKEVNPLEIKKSLAGTPGNPGNTFKLHLEWESGYARAYVSKTESNDIVNESSNLYQEDTLWTIGDKLFVYLKSQDGEFTEYIIETKAADERSTENGIENVVFKFNDEEIDFTFNEETTSYGPISVPYIVQELTVIVTLKDPKETLNNATGYIYGIPSDCVVEVSIPLIEGEETIYKLLGISEKETEGTEYSFSFEREEGIADNYIESLEINGIDCIESELGQYFDNAFDKTKNSFSMYLSKSTADIQFDITLSSKASFTTSLGEDIISSPWNITVETGTEVLTFDITVFSEVNRVTNTEGRTYTISIYLADTSTEITDEQLILTVDGEPLSDIDGNLFQFDPSNKNQPSITVPYSTKSINYSVEGFLGMVLLTKEISTYLARASEDQFLLDVGTNTINLKVYSELGKLSIDDENISEKADIYTLTIEREAGSQNVLLDYLGIKIDNDELKILISDVTESTTDEFHIEYVNPEAESATITATPNDPKATITSNLEDISINLSDTVIKQVLTITVAAEDEDVTKDYQIILWTTRANPSNDTTFQLQTIRNKENKVLTPSYNPTNKFSYTLHLSEKDEDSEIRFEINKPQTAILVVVDADGNKAEFPAIGTASSMHRVLTSSYSIPTNSTKIVQMYLIAEDKTSTIDTPYIFTITRDPNTDATLKEFKLNGTTVEGFDSADKGGDYTIYVSNDDTSTYTLSGTLNQETSSILSNNCTNASLEVGENIFTLVTIAEDETTSYTYTLHIIKDAPAELTDLEVYVEDEAKDLTPSFSATTYEYQVNLLYKEDSIRFVPSTYEQNSIKLFIDEEEQDSFEISEIPFGTTLTYVIRVYTASDESVDYTISVYREEPNHDATLHDLSIAGRTLQGFEPGVAPTEGQEYVYYIGNSETVTINVILTEVTSTITSDPVVNQILEIGDNTFNIVTLAEDGETSCTYVVKVVKDAPLILEHLEVIVDGENYLPDFISEETYYGIDIEYEQNAVEFIYSSSYAEQGYLTLTLLNGDETPLVSNQITDIPMNLNTYIIRVQAQSGAYEDYTVEVYRDPGSDECYIESYIYYKNSTETESLEILEDKTEYSYPVDRNTTIFNPTITISDKATITMPDDLSLTPGQANQKTIVVTSQNGHEREYIFTVYPADTAHTITDINLLSAEAGETILGVDKTSYIDFENGIYTLMVPNAIDEVYLEILGGTDYSTIYLNDSIFTNGMLSLNENENELKIYIQSEYDKLNPSSDIKEEVTLVITRVVDPVVTIHRTGLSLGEPDAEETILYGDELTLDLSIVGHTLKSASANGKEITFAENNYIYKVDNVTEDIAIEVEYEANEYEITINIVGEGTVTPEATDGKVLIPFGATQEFKFLPSEGYVLKEILLDGYRHFGTTLTLGFVDETASDHTITVTFEIISYTISLDITGKGYIQRNDLSEAVKYNEGTHSLSVPYGTNLDLGFVADPGNELVSVKVNGASKELADSFTEVIKGTYTIAIEFGPIAYEIEVENATGNGQISPNENKAYYYHESATYTFTPNTGYHVSEILIDGVPLSKADLDEAILNGYTFSNIEDSHTLSVSFEINTYSITVIQSANGYIKDSLGEVVGEDPIIVEYGSSITFTFEPFEDCSTVNLFIDGREVAAAPTYTFTSIVADHSVSAYFKGNVTTYSVYHHLQYLDSDDYEEIYISSEEATVNDEVQYLVPPITGFEAAPVLPIIVQPNGTSRVDVYYQRLSYDITYVNHQGVESFSGAGTYRYGADVVIEASFTTGYRFAGFTTNNETLLPGSTENPYSFTMPAGNIEFDFELTRYFQIEISPIRNGMISLNPGIYEVAEGETLTVNFEPNEGYVIDALVVNSMRFENYGQNSYTFTRVRSNYTFAVYFKQLLYTVTTTMIENGLPAFEDIVELPYGSTKEITILPRTGYNLVNVIVDDVSLGPIPSYTLEDIKEPHTIQVEVEQEYFRIVVTSTEGGTVNPLGNAVVMYGADKFFTFIPDTGYYVKNVRLDNRQDLGQISSYIFERVVNDHSLHIEFEQYTYTITHNTPEHGRIEADGDLTVPYGSDRTMTFTPDEGFVIADVKINGISVGALSGYTFLNIQENQDVVVEFEQIFFNIDVQISGNGSMNPNESLTVPYGTNQTFVITPEQGYYISRLEIDGRVTQIVEEYVFEHIVANHTISVEFEKLVYNIDVDIEGQGNVDIADNLVVDYGTDLVIHITPDYGQRIQLIELDENGISVANVIELANVTQNHHIRIVFEQIRYTLTIEQIGNGSINPSSSSIVVNYGDEQTFSFLPDRGNGVKDVKVDEESLGSISTYRLEDIQANHTIRVEFEELFHTITVTSNGHGTVTPEGEKEYAHDSNLACRFEPDEGYYISDIIVDGNSVGNEITGYYFAAITEDHTIEVQFSAILFSMIVSFGPHGTITYSTEEGPMVPNDVINVAYGSTIDFTITPDANYIPKIWINNEVTDSVTELSIENIQRNYLIQVDFTQLVRIDITHEGNGVVPESNEYVIYTPLTLVFTPDPGNKVKEILIDGLTVGSVDNYTFPTLISSHTVNVIFEQIIYSVHSTIHGEGTVVGNKNLNQLFYADSCVVTITPEEGWSLGIVFVDGEQTEVVNNQITIKNIDDDVEIVVYFSEIPVRAIPMWIFILLGVIILILIILLILVSIFNKKRKDRYRY